MNPAIKNLIRPHYLELSGYVSAGMESDKNAQKIFMNANENPFELPGLEGYNRYPEPQPKALLEGYANLYGVQPENIVATRGADEALIILTKIFCEPHQDSVIICPPTFGMYGVDARAMPAGVIEVPLIKTESGSFDLNFEGLADAAFRNDTNVQMVFLCSPNNPTGTSFERETMIKLCKELEGQAIVVVDETYAEFSTQGSMIGFLEECPNLIILRTLSKSYSMAGMRTGCFISGDTDFVSLVRAKALDAYPIPKASIDAALKVINPTSQKLAKENIQKLLAERDRLRKAFEATDSVTHIYPSDANFLLIEMKNTKDFIKHCAAQNIIIRDFTDKPLTENCVRISPGLPEENDLLIALLETFDA